MILEDMINELRAELAACIFTKAERADAEAELAALLAQRNAVVEAANNAFEGEAFDATERP